MGNAHPEVRNDAPAAPAVVDTDEDLVKFLVVGAERAGKSFILEAVGKSSHEFPLDRDRAYLPTIGVDFVTQATDFQKDHRNNESDQCLLGERHRLDFCPDRWRKLQIWEAAGQERWVFLGLFLPSAFVRLCAGGVAFVSVFFCVGICALTAVSFFPPRPHDETTASRPSRRAIIAAPRAW
jgi:hypothetical protein